MQNIMERILRLNTLTVLFDPDRIDTPAPGWFQPEWWQGRGPVTDLGGRGQALAVDGPIGSAVLRIYHRGGLVRHLSRSRYLFTGRDRTRPFREWRVTRSLFAAGLPVPEPLAAAFSRRGALYTAALVTRRIEPAAELSTAASSMQSAEWFALGKTIARFADAGLQHRDLNATNILVDAEGRFHLLDFDRATLAPGATDPGPMLRRLEHSLVKLGIEPDREAIVRGIGPR
ncbi:MAG: 3-deoxy-D-manno-octulosonic acid kinase [Wenzhouxiangellaceae bacterium]|nr:3-deoxy-D-manno-octulosonic acid kinase [Wenzhouxiangellaceae bacterium]